MELINKRVSWEGWSPAPGRVGKEACGVVWLYPPFVKECFDNLLFDGVIGQGWDAVQVFFAAAWQERDQNYETDTTALNDIYRMSRER